MVVLKRAPILLLILGLAVTTALYLYGNRQSGSPSLGQVRQHHEVSYSALPGLFTILGGLGVPEREEALFGGHADWGQATFAYVLSCSQKWEYVKGGPNNTRLDSEQDLQVLDSELLWLWPQGPQKEPAFVGFTCRPGPFSGLKVRRDSWLEIHGGASDGLLYNISSPVYPDQGVMNAGLSEDYVVALALLAPFHTYIRANGTLPPSLEACLADIHVSPIKSRVEALAARYTSLTFFTDQQSDILVLEIVPKTGTPQWLLLDNRVSPGLAPGETHFMMYGTATQPTKPAFALVPLGTFGELAMSGIAVEAIDCPNSWQPLASAPN